MRTKSLEATRRGTTGRGRLLGAALALALGGCSDGGAAATDVADVADDAGGEAPGDTAAVADTAAADTVTPSPCGEPGTAAVASRVVLRGTYLCSPPSTPNDVVLTSAEDWTAMRVGLSDCISPPTTAEPVDFASEYVLILGTASPMTCGYTYRGVRAFGGDGGPWVEVQVTDTSAGCQAQCASGRGYVVAVALPRAAGETPTGCVWVHAGCP